MHHSSTSTLSDLGTPDRVQAVAGAWYEALVAVHPGLASAEVRTQVDDATTALLAHLAQGVSDPDSLVQIGSEMAALDGLHPRDVPCVQRSLVHVLRDALPEALWVAHASRLTQAMFDLAAGLYIGRSRRAERFNVVVTSRMAHDLKTPINAITGFSRVILKGIDGPITDFQREDLTSIHEAGQRLLAMVDDLYAVRKQDAARSLALDAPFAVADLLGELVRTVQPLAAERDHALVVRMVDSLGEMNLDPSAVRWALLCLFCHMIRRPGGGQITLTAARDYDAGHIVRFTLDLQSPYGSSELPHAVAVSEGGEDTSPSSELSAEQIEAELLACQSAVEEIRGTMSWTSAVDGALICRMVLPIVVG